MPAGTVLAFLVFVLVFVLVFRLGPLRASVGALAAPHIMLVVLGTASVRFALRGVRPIAAGGEPARAGPERSVPAVPAAERRPAHRGLAAPQLGRGPALGMRLHPVTPTERGSAVPLTPGCGGRALRPLAPHPSTLFR